MIGIICGHITTVLYKLRLLLIRIKHRFHENVDILNLSSLQSKYQFVMKKINILKPNHPPSWEAYCSNLGAIRLRSND